MSIRSMDSRLEVLRNGQDITNKSLLYNTGSIQQSQQQIPSVDIDNESNKSDSWVELASPSSRASVVSMNGGDSGSVVLVDKMDNDGVIAGTDNAAVVVGGGNGSPFSRLSPISACSAPIELVIDAGQVHGGDTMAVHYYTRHGLGRCTAATVGMAGLGQGTKRTAEWLEDYNSRPEVQKGSLQASSPVETEMSTPPNSLVPGLDVGELTQSSCCEDEDEELSVGDDGAYLCRCRKSPNIGHESYEKGRWIFSGLLGISTGNGRRAFLLYLVTNLVTLAIGFAVGNQIHNLSGHGCVGSIAKMYRRPCTRGTIASRMVTEMLPSAAGASEVSEVTVGSANDVPKYSNEVEEGSGDGCMKCSKEKLGLQGYNDGENLSTNVMALTSVEENKLKQFALLYEKYNTQCNELERLEKVNGELKEQLQKAMRGRDDTEELLNNCRSEFSTCRESLERRLLDAELQLKTNTQRMQAREQYYQQRIKQNDAKWDQKFLQLLKKTETVEKEKNDAVCRYAAKEAQLMRLQTQLEQLEEQKNMLSEEKNTWQKSAQFECLQNLQHSLVEAERQLELEKEANATRDKEHKMTIKHLEASQTALKELRSRLESMQSQVALEQLEKGQCQEKLKKTQAILKTLERQRTEEMDTTLRKTNNQEELYKNVCDELLCLRSRNFTLSQQLDEVMQANVQSQAESQQLSDKLAQARQEHQVALEKIESLEQIQTQFNSNLRRMELAEIAAMDASTERDQAEAEAAECRRRAERMLEITEQLTDRNSSLTSQQEMLRYKNLELNRRMETLESSVSAYKKHIAELERELELLKVDSSAEIKMLRQQIDANIAKGALLDVFGITEQQLNGLINELRNEQDILRKKNSSSLKELRAEVQYLRKLQSQNSNSSPRSAVVEDNSSLPVLPAGAADPSTSSRASSIASCSDWCSLAVPVSYSTAGGCRHITQQKESQQFLTSPSPDETNHVQQQMIEKIVKLQRQLARRQDKVEFLEEHVRQCTRELLKKSKIIQNYALREEAALLLPENDLNKVPRGPTASSNSSSSLIGNLFASGASGASRKSELEFATEVNSRLQAVLEDALHKNITLKNNIDTLGEEISRLSRENRQLALSKVM
uniref:Uncharacterized protein n=1 Tax=Setaria digitata TaxID=48799 RepID=A0A915PVY1_9BILA